MPIKKILLLLLISFMTLLTANAQNDIILSCPDNNHPHAIDLGLPSGTKWACCNVGADTPDDYGGYYAWGETEEKDVYNWLTYIHCDGPLRTCNDLGNDIAGTQYDVAHVKWGGSWVMPSYDQIKELSQWCEYAYKWTGIKGGQFFSNETGGSIFLPAAGFYVDSTLTLNMYGNYWLSTQYPSATDCAYSFYTNFSTATCGFSERFYGQSVRPVFNESVNINPLESSSDKAGQGIFNLYGIKVASNPKERDNLLPGIYVINGKKIVIK